MSNHNDELYLTFWQHVEELRKTVLWILFFITAGTTVALYFFPYIYSILMSTVQKTPKTPFILLTPTEGVTTTIKASFWVGFATSSPLWLYKLSSFALPAIEKKKHRTVVPFLTIALLSAIAGGFFATSYTIPIANRYLLSFNEGLGENFWSLSSYLNYTLLLILSNALAFEAVAILLFCIHMQWISVYTLIKQRKTAIVLIFILSAVFSPPDIFSQLILAIPLTIAYEAIIFYGKLRKKT